VAPRRERSLESKEEAVETAILEPVRCRGVVSVPVIVDVAVGELISWVSWDKKPEEVLEPGEAPRIWRTRAKSATVEASPDEVPAKNTQDVSSALALLNVGSGSAYLRTRIQSKYENVSASL